MSQEASIDKLALTDDIMSSFKCCKIFTDAKKNINSLDFSKDGKWLAVGSEDNSVTLYDIETGL